MPEHHLVTGAAGFIGSQLVDKLLLKGHRVSGLDNFLLGREEHIIEARHCDRFFFQKADVSSLSETAESIRAAIAVAGSVDFIWHLAANSDIPAGVADNTVDFRHTLQTTFATLDAAKRFGIRKFAFSSTSAIYGDHSAPLAENSGPLLPISNYGATKLASEALISAAAETFLSHMWIFRFANVVGPRSTHGAIYDFVRQLHSRPKELLVLGDGTQTKPYLHVSELLDAMCFIVDNAHERRNVFNIGPDDKGCSVAFMAEQTVARARPGTAIRYSGGSRGWIGDVPRFRYDTSRLAGLGWKPKLSSEAAVVRAVDELCSDSDSTSSQKVGQCSVNS